MRSAMLVLVAAVAGFAGGQLRPVAAAPEKAPAKGYTLGQMDQYGGLWVGDQGPTAGLYGDRGNKSVAIVFNTDPTGNNIPFAIAADKDGTFFQVVDKDGGYHRIPVSALVKLDDAPATVVPEPTPRLRRPCCQ